MSIDQDSTARQAEELIAALAEIPVAELVACARENLRATKTTRTTRGQKDPETGERLPDTVTEPDYAVRQKALEWISAQRAGAPSARKPLEPVKTSGDDKPEPGVLRVKSPKRTTDSNPPVDRQ